MFFFVFPTRSVVQLLAILFPAIVNSKLDFTLVSQKYFTKWFSFVALLTSVAQRRRAQNEAACMELGLQKTRKPISKKGTYVIHHRSIIADVVDVDNGF